MKYVSCVLAFALMFCLCGHRPFNGRLAKFADRIVFWR